MPKVSIILPVYNGESYLANAVNSVLNQSYRDFELIIIDDCSTDNTPNIINQYLNLHKNIIYVKNDKNLQLPATLNKGFSLAKGEYWTWTSCDNIYLDHAISCLVEGLETSPDIGLVYSDMEIINENGKVEGNIIAADPEDLILRNVIGACFLYRSSVAKQVGLYNKEMFLCEDYEYWLRIARVAKIKPINQVLYRYRRHAKSLSYNYEKNIIAKGILMQKKYYKYFVTTRRKAALFYAYLRARDIYNPFRQFYLFKVLFFSPIVFLQEMYGLIIRRFKSYEKN